MECLVNEICDIVIKDMKYIITRNKKRINKKTNSLKITLLRREKDFCFVINLFENFNFAREIYVKSFSLKKYNEESLFNAVINKLLLNDQITFAISEIDTFNTSRCIEIEFYRLNLYKDVESINIGKHQWTIDYDCRYITLEGKYYIKKNFIPLISLKDEILNKIKMKPKIFGEIYKEYKDNIYKGQISTITNFAKKKGCEFVNEIKKINFESI